MVTPLSGLAVICGWVAPKLYDIQVLKAIGKQINEIESMLGCTGTASGASIERLTAVSGEDGSDWKHMAFNKVKGTDRPIQPRQSKRT